MARPRSEKLYSLSEAAEKTGISVASLRRYRSLYPERVPSVGEGRRQRFPEAALHVFRELKREGMARRGRRGRGSVAKRRGGATRKAQGKRRSAAARSRSAAGTGGDRDALLTLVTIGRRTGISYPTLLRYVRLYLERLPHSGTGRKRRFHPAAVAEFQKLREQSRQGRRGGGSPSQKAAPSVSRQLATLERGQRDLARQLRELRKELRRPLRVRLER